MNKIKSAFDFLFIFIWLIWEVLRLLLLVLACISFLSSVFVHRFALDEHVASL